MNSAHGWLSLWRAPACGRDPSRPFFILATFLYPGLPPHTQGSGTDKIKSAMHNSSLSKQTKQTNSKQFHNLNKNHLLFLIPSNPTNPDQAHPHPHRQAGRPGRQDRRDLAWLIDVLKKEKKEPGTGGLMMIW